MLAELSAGFIQQTLMLLYPEIRADLIPVRFQQDVLFVNQEGHEVWNGAACPKSQLRDKFIQIVQYPPDGPMHDLAEINVHITEELTLSRLCRTDPVGLPEIIQAGEAKIGLPRSLYVRLMEQAADPNAPFHFTIYPRGMTPAAMLPGVSGTEDGDAG